MRKKIYFLIFVMALSFAASAQRFEYQLGLKGGLGLSFLHSNDDQIVNKDNGSCYKFGFTGVYYFAENYGVTSGFNVLGYDLSYKFKDSETNITTQRNLHSTYCQIPILLKMRTDQFSDKYRAFGEIGYGLNFHVSEQDKHDYHHPYRDVCSSFILHLGVEMEVLNRSTLLFMLSYDNFFSSMMSMSNKKLTMSNLCFEIGFLF
ncbi:MAG: outer membrane beta-barrel protein [Bacteroidales bacterium]|nr:outer membrane beta-barrel protein [Bacteroidales bacterium]